MGQRQVSKLAKQFKRTFSEPALNALGKAAGFCKGERDITPYQLCLGLIEVFADSKVETIADIHRAFNALCHIDFQYKPSTTSWPRPSFLT